MELTLFVPGLLLPDEVMRDTVFDLEVPTLSLLLGRGQRQQLSSNWLSEVFGVAGDLPAASLRKFGAGDTAAGHWLCLDPVHWQVSRQGISLDDPLRLKLTSAEAGALIEAVQPLFSGWGNLSDSAPGCWEIQLHRPAELKTRPLHEAVQQPVDPALPGGSDGPAWRRLLAEAQTLLHVHPVNRERAALDRPTVNSLWPWGGGNLPEPMPAGFDVAWSDDPVLAGLCALAGLPCLKPPERFQPASGSVLASLDHLAAPARTLDALAWRAALITMDHDWLAPAWQAMKQGDCAALRIVGTCSGATRQTLSISLRNRDRWRFWRRSRPLTALTASA